MVNLSFIQIGEDIINVNHISEISYDEALNQHYIIMNGEIGVIVIPNEIYDNVISFIKEISNFRKF